MLCVWSDLFQLGVGTALCKKGSECQLQGGFDKKETFSVLFLNLKKRPLLECSFIAVSIQFICKCFHFVLLVYFLFVDLALLFSTVYYKTPGGG